MRIDGIETHTALKQHTSPVVAPVHSASARCASALVRPNNCWSTWPVAVLRQNRITDHHHDRGLDVLSRAGAPGYNWPYGHHKCRHPVAARHRKIGQGCVRGWVPDPLDSSERSVEPASGIRNRKFNRAVDDTKSITALRKHAQRVIGVDDIAVCLQQRNAIGQATRAHFPAHLRARRLFSSGSRRRVHVDSAGKVAA